MLPMKSAMKNSPLSQLNNDKCERILEEQCKKNVDVRNENKTYQKFSDESEKRGTEKISHNNFEKRFANRLSKLKEAGQRMIETGETTRVTSIKSQKK